MLFAASVATPQAFSSSDRLPPNRFDQRAVPLDAYLARKMSPPPELAIAPAPKLTLLLAKEPVTTTSPAPSIAIARPTSSADPPTLFDQRCPPLLPAYCATKMSLPPVPARDPPPKSAVPVEWPVIARLPLPSTASPYTNSSADPPTLFDQRCAPVDVSFTRNTSAEPALVRLDPPKLDVW